MIVGRRVVMTLAFYPRGGSAQVVRYLGGALEAAGHEVTVCSGSMGSPGSSSHAATFFAGLDTQALDFTEAATWFDKGQDPMAAPVPFHPSFEDRPGVPDRVFASLDDDVYHRQVAVWRSLLERVLDERPDDADAFTALCDLYRHGDKPGALADLLDSALSTTPDVEGIGMRMELAKLLERRP